MGRWPKKYKWMLLGGVLSWVGPLGEYAVLHLVPEGMFPPIVMSYVYTEVITFISFCLFGFLLGSYAEKVETLAFLDPLTKANSRHYLMARLDELITMNSRHGEGFTLVMFDLDRFKKVNDDYGHVVGDQTLKAFATCAIEHKRRSDTFGRYGGEEFILLCPKTDLTAGVALAERIRAELEKLGENELGFPGPQTVSAGVYEMLPDVLFSAEELIDMADKTLYDAKVQGRNRVVAAGAVEPQEDK